MWGLRSGGRLDGAPCRDLNHKENVFKKHVNEQKKQIVILFKLKENIQKKLKKSYIQIISKKIYIKIYICN